MEFWTSKFLIKDLKVFFITTDTIKGKRYNSTQSFKSIFAGLEMNMWLLVCVLGIAFGQDFQDLLDEVNDCIYVDVFLEPF